jgi:hypothetical protein
MREDGIIAIEPKTYLDSWTSPQPRRTDSAAGLFICRQLPTRCACSGRPRDRSRNHFMVSDVGNRQFGALPWRTPINYETAQAACSRWR